MRLAVLGPCRGLLVVSQRNCKYHALPFQQWEPKRTSLGPIRAAAPSTRTMRIVIANFGAPLDRALDFDEYWRAHTMPPRREKRLSLFEQRVDWGFHIYSIGVYLMDQGLADC